MAVPASFAPVFTATFQGRLGDYLLTVWGRAAALPPGTPAFRILRMSGAPTLACADGGRQFGGGLMPWSAEYDLVDPAVPGAPLGLVDFHFGDEFDPEDYLCHLTGPGGLPGAAAGWGGETARANFSLWTRPVRGEVSYSSSPLVESGRRVVRLGTSDGASALADAEAVDASRTAVIAALAGNLWPAMPGRTVEDAAALGPPAADWWEVHVAPALAFPEAASALLGDVRFPQHPVGDGDRSDLGTAYDLVRGLCEAMTLTAYQPCIYPEGPDSTTAPRWEVVARSRIGRPEATTVQAGQAAPTAGTLPSRSRSLPPRTADAAGSGSAGRIRRVGVIRLEGEGQAAFPVDGATLGDGETEVRAFGRFTPQTPDGGQLRFRLSGFLRDPSASPGVLRLVLDGDDGSTYYGPAWSTSPATMGDFGQTVTTAAMPTSGTLSVLFEGADYDVGAGDEPTTWTGGAVALEDPSGDPVTDFVARAGEPGGDEVALVLLPPLETFDGSAWAKASRYDSDISGVEHGTIAEMTASVRAAQQATNLVAVEAEVSGLWGPETLFTLTGRDDGAAGSPFRRTVSLVVTSAEPDLRRGTTRLSLTEARDAVLDGEVLA